MEKYLSKLTWLAYTAFRVVAGLLFAQHGAQKLFGFLGGMGEAGGSAPFLSMMFFAGLVEFFGGVLVALGLGTRWAAFLASGQMAFAYFMAHAPQGFWPILNRGELAMLYCFLFFYIACRGGGKVSLDALFGISKKNS
jgi:putative oxidoreductase